LSLTSVGLETGTWEVYIPGYAVAAAIASGTTTIAIKTEYSGVDDPLWVTVPIRTRQGSVYTHDDVDAAGRIVKVITGIPGTTSILGPYLQKGVNSSGNPTWYTEPESVAGQGVVGKTGKVRTYTSSLGSYKVSYIEVEEMRDYGSGPVSYVYESTLFNPTLGPDASYTYYNNWDFSVGGMSGNGYTVPESDANITVTVHYFYGGDVVRGKHINIFGSNADTKYTIAYINRTTSSSSGYEYGGLGNGLESIVVLDTPNTATFTAEVAYTTLSTPNSEGFSLPDMEHLAKVLYRIQTDGFNASLITTAPARYWSSDRGFTVNLGGFPLVGYPYKDNAILTNRSTTTPTLASISPSSAAYGVATPGGWTGTYAGNPLTLIDSALDTGYVQLVKTVNITP
jgi:hypothetical protein